MKIKISDFEKKDGISLDINKYREKVPNEVIEFWEEYGIGSFSSGYIKSVNPDEMAGFDFFFEDIVDENFQKKYLRSDQYTHAFEILGKPDYEEGYGYFPLLGAGGTEDVNRLQKVLIKEHILTIISLVGAIS